MSFTVLQTPQKPLPGAFVQTPAAQRYQSGADPRRQLFRSQSSSGQQSNGVQSQGSAPAQQQQQSSQIQSQTQAPPLLPVQRAARTINEVLQRDANFPDLDSYVKREFGVTLSEDILTLKQKEYHPNTIFPPRRRMPHGHRIKRLRCMIFPTKYLSSTIMRKFQR